MIRNKVFIFKQNSSNLLITQIMAKINIVVFLIKIVFHVFMLLLVRLFFLNINMILNLY